MFDIVFGIVKEAIDSQDALGLLDMGAPKNEYDYESREIASKISKENSIDEIAAICSSVFTRQFYESSRFEMENFVEVAMEIKSGWEKYI